MGLARQVWCSIRRSPASTRSDERLTTVTVGGAVPITAEITERAADELGVTVGADAWVSVKATEIETYAA